MHLLEGVSPPPLKTYSPLTALDDISSDQQNQIHSSSILPMNPKSSLLRKNEDSSVIIRKKNGREVEMTPSEPRSTSSIAVYEQFLRPYNINMNAMEAKKRLRNIDQVYIEDREDREREEREF